jgi:hypothetical protein
MANGLAETAPATIERRAASSPGAPRTGSRCTSDFLVILATLVLFNTKLDRPRAARPSFRWTTDAPARLAGAGLERALEGARRGTPAAGAPGNDRKAIEAAAAQLAKVAGRNTVAGTLAAEIRGHAAATPAKVFAWPNLAKALVDRARLGRGRGRRRAPYRRERPARFSPGSPRCSRWRGSRACSPATACSSTTASST